MGTDALPVSDTRHEFYGLQDVYLPIAVGVWVAFVLVVGFAVVRYRRRRNAVPSQREERPLLEGSYAVLLTGVAAFLCYLTFHTEDRVDRVSSHPGLNVHVTASRWQWRFDYPRLGIRIGPETGTRKTTLVVPVATTVRFTGTSQDVIHSFWVPDRRYKHDLFPGARTVFDLRWPRVGLETTGECGEFCGLDHAYMRFDIRVLGRSAFRRWAATHRTGGAA